MLKGNDPVAELEKKREAARQVVTFGSLAEKYLSDPSPFDKVKAPNTVKEERRIAKKDLLPAWENRQLTPLPNAMFCGCSSPSRRTGIPDSGKPDAVSDRFYLQLRHRYTWRPPRALPQPRPARQAPRQEGRSSKPDTH